MFRNPEISVRLKMIYQLSAAGNPQAKAEQDDRWLEYHSLSIEITLWF